MPTFNSVSAVKMVTCYPFKAIQAIAGRLLAGEIMVLPTDTVYGLVAAVNSPVNLHQLYALKNRPLTKSLPVIVTDLKMATTVGVITNQAQAWLQRCWPGKVTLVVKPTPAWQQQLPKGQSTIAIRITSNHWLKQIIKRTGPLWATSFNQSGSTPISTPRLKLIPPGIDGVVLGPRLTHPASLIVDVGTNKILRASPGALKPGGLNHGS